jgi:hypothetical protein
MEIWVEHDRGAVIVPGWTAYRWGRIDAFGCYESWGTFWFNARTRTAAFTGTVSINAGTPQEAAPLFVKRRCGDPPADSRSAMR